jgi:hypothetical protein
VTTDVGRATSAVPTGTFHAWSTSIEVAVGACAGNAYDPATPVGATKELGAMNELPPKRGLVGMIHLRSVERRSRRMMVTASTVAVQLTDDDWTTGAVGVELK